MKKTILLNAMIGVFLVFPFSIHAKEVSTNTENWKGPLSEKRYTLSGMAGFGTYNAKIGPSFMLAGGTKIIHQGFAPEINNQVFLEGEAGPLFISGSTAFVYSIHARWDFGLNQDWTFFALGGLGGSITGSGLGNSWRIFPRFGIGAHYALSDQWMLRAEVSQELYLFGITFAL